jgi:hypothetical protein
LRAAIRNFLYLAMLKNMDLKKEILASHSKAQCNKIVKYIGTSKSRFSELVKIYVDGPFRITQRAAWPLTYAAEGNPALVAPHLGLLLKTIRKEDIHDAVKRNTVRLLQFIEIPKKYHSDVTDICFNFLADKKQAAAVRVFSMSVLLKMSLEYPELKNDLRVLVEDEMPFASAAFRSRGKKVLKQLGPR